MHSQTHQPIDSVCRPVKLTGCICLATLTLALQMGPLLTNSVFGLEPPNDPSTSDPSTSDPSIPSSNSVDADASSKADVRYLPTAEGLIRRRTDAYRGERGLPELGIDASLSQAARSFAAYMARTDRYGHRADGRTPSQRAVAAGYQYCVVRENIAYRTDSRLSDDGQYDEGSVGKTLGEFFIQGWIDSPPHQENIVADYVTQTGVGVATIDGLTFYAVQLFGRPKSESFGITITNPTEQLYTLIFASDDTEDDYELDPRTRFAVRRCIPCEIRLSRNNTPVGDLIKVDATTTFKVTPQGLIQQPPNPTDQSQSGDDR